MKKLTLDVDAIRVESFDLGAGSGSGTVRGHDTGAYNGCTAGAGDCYVNSVNNSCGGSPALCGADGGDDGTNNNCGTQANQATCAYTNCYQQTCDHGATCMQITCTCTVVLAIYCFLTGECG